MLRRRNLVFGAIGMVVAGFLVMQIIPIGRIYPAAERKPDPPVAVTIEWKSPETEHMVRAACYDCHSNETAYPWYANIAPVSWLVSRDINNGRAAMNFSEDAPTEYNISDLEWHLLNNMPPKIYVVMHPEAVLTEDQKALLLAGFKETLVEASDHGMDMSG